LLAGRIGYDFIDVDELIERAEGRSIVEIFRESGEAYFREVERKILMETVLKLSNFVISLGGGTVTFSDNLYLIKKFGILVYLKASPETLLNRVRSKVDRPLLLDSGNTLSEEKLLNRIKMILAFREPFYSQSDVIVSTDNKPVGETVREIIEKLRGKIKIGEI
jgi:shikimate kinase